MDFARSSRHPSRTDRQQVAKSPATALLMSIIVLITLAFFVTHARGQPPEGADPSLAPWFQSLHQPGTGVSCCSIADCRQTDYRTNGYGYEALIDGAWLVVPSEKVLHRVDNPTGRAVVCYMPGRGIMCFVTPEES